MAIRIEIDPGATGDLHYPHWPVNHKGNNFIEIDRGTTAVKVTF